MIKIGYNDSSQHYGLSTHYEKPSRVNFCVNKLKKELAEEYFLQKLSEINSEKVIELVKQVHTNEYVERIVNFKSHIFICRNCEKKKFTDEAKTFNDLITNKEKCVYCVNLFDLSNMFCYLNSDTFYTGYTFTIALEAIDVIVDLLNIMKKNEINYTFALVRPPGHHCNNNPNGFCIFNNAFVGAKYAQKLGFEKVLILDVDFHHGDGTQELLEANDEPNISFVSIHGYGKTIYPGTGFESNLDKNILNIPLQMTHYIDSREYITDEFYQSILNSQVFPFIENTNPNLIIVSLGFDAHQADPLEGMNITDETYIYLTSELKKLNIPVMFLLEGGYNIETIGRIIPQMVNVLK